MNSNKRIDRLAKKLNLNTRQGEERQKKNAKHNVYGKENNQS